MGIKMPYLEPGIESLSCDRCCDPNAIHGKIVVLCSDCAERLVKLLEERNIDFDFDMEEIEY